MMTSMNINTLNNKGIKKKEIRTVKSTKYDLQGAISFNDNQILYFITVTNTKYYIRLYI